MAISPVGGVPPASGALRGALAPLPGPGACLAELALIRCAHVDGLRDPRHVDISRDGRTLYATVGGNRSITVLHRDRGSGVLTRSACWSSAPGGCGVARGLGRLGEAISGPWDVAVSPDGRNVYVASWGGQTRPDGTPVFAVSIVAFARAPTAGGLAQLAGTAGCAAGVPYDDCAVVGALRETRSRPGARGPYLTVAPDGRAVYVATATSLVTFARDRTTGALTQRTCFSNVEVGCEPLPGLGVHTIGNVVTSPDSRFVYVVAPWAGITLLRRTPSAGGLRNCSTRTKRCHVTLGFEQDAMAISPDGDSLYAGGPNSSPTTLRRDHATGVLTRVPGCLAEIPLRRCTYVRLEGTDAITVTPNGRTVYTVTGSDEPEGRPIANEGHPPNPFAFGPGVGVFEPGGSGSLRPLPGRHGCVNRTGLNCIRGFGIRHYGLGRDIVISPDGRNVYVTFDGIAELKRIR